MENVFLCIPDYTMYSFWLTHLLKIFMALTMTAGKKVYILYNCAWKENC